MQNRHTTATEGGSADNAEAVILCPYILYYGPAVYNGFAWLNSRFQQLYPQGDCAKNLVRLRWWKTQPPKSPLSGGLSTQFPPDKGG